jgi:hypothetical protein
MRRWWSKIARILDRHRGLDDDLRDEFRAHLAFAFEDNLARGMAPADARTAAVRRLGNPTASCERAREARQFAALETRNTRWRWW